MSKKVQSYRYKRNDSILGEDIIDEYQLSLQEFFSIYDFFLVKNLCRSGSLRKKKLKELGWDSLQNSGLKEKMYKLLPLDTSFVFLNKDDSIGDKFKAFNLDDGELKNLTAERGVIGHTPEDNQYYKLFHRIRNCFAHGSYVLKYSSNHEKMVVLQDQDSINVTARIVLKLNTILSIIQLICEGEKQ